LGELRLDGHVRADGPFELPLADVTELELGPAHSCARTSAGDVYCWGANDAGQCGRSMSVKNVGQPSKVASDVAEVSIAEDATWLLGKDGSARALGRVWFRAPGVTVKGNPMRDPWHACDYGCFAERPVRAPFPGPVAKLLRGQCARLRTGEEGCLDFGIPRAAPSGGGICDDAWCPWDWADDECHRQRDAWICGRKMVDLDGN
jgi:hypothetical protein